MSASDQPYPYATLRDIAVRSLRAVSWNKNDIGPAHDAGLDDLAQKTDHHEHAMRNIAATALRNLAEQDPIGAAIAFRENAKSEIMGKTPPIEIKDSPAWRELTADLKAFAKGEAVKDSRITAAALRSPNGFLQDLEDVAKGQGMWRATQRIAAEYSEALNAARKSLTLGKEADQNVAPAPQVASPVDKFVSTIVDLQQRFKQTTHSGERVALLQAADNAVLSLGAGYLEGQEMREYTRAFVQNPADVLNRDSQRRHIRERAATHVADVRHGRGVIDLPVKEKVADVMKSLDHLRDRTFYGTPPERQQCETAVKDLVQQLGGKDTTGVGVRVAALQYVRGEFSTLGDLRARISAHLQAAARLPQQLARGAALGFER